jgi:hypothetical protein
VIIPFSEQAQCVMREIKLRRRAYPRLIASQRLSQAAADREIATMEAVLETVQLLGRSERLL